MKTNSPTQSTVGNSVRSPVSWSLRLSCLLAGTIALSLPNPGISGTSNLEPARVSAVPLINQPLIPDAVAPGGSGFMITVNGTGFESRSVINWNGSPRATTFVNGSQLTANILASDIATAGTASVTVVTPAPGGGTSNQIFFSAAVATSSVTLKRSDIPIVTTATGPLDIVTADLDLDGRLDLAIANGCCDPNPGHNVSILFGNGDGTFQNQVDFPTAAAPNAVIVADVNRDGVPDLITAEYDRGKVSVLLGKGDGTFQPQVNYDTARLSEEVVTADFNQDGELDLAVCNAVQSTVSILLGRGSGIFEPSHDFAAGDIPQSVTEGEFNGDGKIDLAIANNSEMGVSVLLGNGDGTFRAPVSYAAGTFSIQVATADLNGDGKLDLVVSNNSSNTVSILLANADGIFQGHKDYAVGMAPKGIVMSDFNADGKMDLAISNQNSNTVSILLGNGDGTIQPHIDYPTGTFPDRLCAGDFNGDGRIDLAAVDVFGDAVSILLQVSTTVPNGSR